MIQKSQALSLPSYPKVNLALDILGETLSGYHEIATIFHQLAAPFDELVFELHESPELITECTNPKLPVDETNTMVKAASLLQKFASVQQGAKIFIKKRIPLMSGLGGGASNAATALIGLGKLWGIECCPGRLHTKTPECLLRRIANQIGMDCAFFFYGGTALGEHFGETITPLVPLPRTVHIEVIETGIEVSSRDAYSLVDLSRCGKNKKRTKAFTAALAQQNSHGIIENLHNDFEEFVYAAHPDLLEVKREHEAEKSGRVMLCGSGGALVRIYE